MALTAEQNATLQLLLERGQSYPDLATLLGVDESEVRSRARGALTELAGEDPDRTVALTDYLLGQADPIGRADAVRHLRDDPGDLRLAQSLVDTLRATYPNAELPRLPGEARPPRRARVADGDRPGGLQLPSLTTRQSRIVALLAAGVVILVTVVLAIAGVFDGGDEGSPAETTAAEETGETAVPVPVEPVGDSKARGAVVFGFATEDQPFIGFQITGLEPPADDEAYVLWFLTDNQNGVPVPVPLNVNGQGRLVDQLSVPAETIAVATQSNSIVIALDSRQGLSDYINEEIGAGAQQLRFRGEPVLRADLIRRGNGSGNGSSAE